MTVPGLSLRQRVRALEEELRWLRSQVELARTDTPAHVPPKDVWLGRVVDDPEPGDDTVRVHLLSARFDRTTGQQALLTHDRDSYVIARTFPARSHRRNDYVRVERIRGRLAGDAERGEWWICEGPVELRWGRVGTSMAPIPDLSTTGVTRAVPIYEVELGHLTWNWPVVDRAGLGLGPLDNATAAIDQTLCDFTADVPAVHVPAASLIGDLHRGQPVLLADEGGRWAIVGPTHAVESRERLVFASGFTELADAYENAIVAGDRLSFDLQSAYGTGGNGGPPTAHHDIEFLTQSQFSEAFARVTRRGDYLIGMRWRPKPYRYGYMTGGYDANEVMTLTGDTIETTTSGGHTHFVDVLYQTPVYWEVALTLEVIASVHARATPTVLEDLAVLRYDAPLGEYRQALGWATFNKGDELRLTLSIDGDNYSPAALSERGVQLSGVELFLCRIPGGGTWIP